MDTEPRIYQIKVEGTLDEGWSSWLDVITLTSDGQTTTLTSSMADQSALRGTLCKLWDLNLTLISVTQIEVDPSTVSSQDSGG